MFAIGDTVWVARYERQEVIEECPVCFTKKKVTLILGDGTEVEMECDFCKYGYEPSRGYITVCKIITNPTQFTITAREIKETTDGITIEYHAGSYVLHEEEVFDNHDDALELGEKYAAERQKEEDERFLRLTKTGTRTSSYSAAAGYHLREAKRAEADAKRHREAARICKERSRDKNKPNT